MGELGGERAAAATRLRELLDRRAASSRLGGLGETGSSRGFDPNGRGRVQVEAAPDLRHDLRRVPAPRTQRPRDLAALRVEEEGGRQTTGAEQEERLPGSIGVGLDGLQS